MNKTEIWVLIIVVIVALTVVLLGVQTTGQAAKHNMYTVRYRSCHYLDYDVRGECIRIERQNRNNCDPPETVPLPLLGNYGKRPMNWFYRICEPPHGTLSY